MCPGFVPDVSQFKSSIDKEVPDVRVFPQSIHVCVCIYLFFFFTAR
jgi:hypothetical protein